MVSFRQWVWLGNLLLLAAVSYSAAALAMQMLGSRLESDTPVAAVAGPVAQPQERREKMALTAFQPVLDDNIFRARRTEVKPSTETETAGTQKVQPQGPKAPLNLVLTGTVIMGKRSFAMVADAGGRNEQVYARLDCLPAEDEKRTRDCAPNQAQLVDVQRKKITVDYHGEKLTFELSDRPATAVAAAAPSRAPIPSRGPVRRHAAPPSTTNNAPFPMTQDGNSFEVRVPSTEVSAAFDNFAEVLKMARVVPYSDASGQGFQIRNIRPGSIFARIGLNNFDKIKAVNGEAITTADQAMRLLTVFRNEKEITLDLERNNQPVQFNYVIE